MMEEVLSNVAAAVPRKRIQKLTNELIVDVLVAMMEEAAVAVPQ